MECVPGLLPPGVEAEGMNVTTHLSFRAPFQNESRCTSAVPYAFTACAGTTYNLSVPVNEIHLDGGGGITETKLRGITLGDLFQLTAIPHSSSRIHQTMSHLTCDFTGVSYIYLSLTAVIDVGFTCRVRTRLCSTKDKQLLQGRLCFLRCLLCGCMRIV